MTVNKGSGLCLLFVLCGTALSGCEQEPNVVPKVIVTKPTLLTQFGGRWVLNIDKTLAALKAAGESTEQMEELRLFYEKNPALNNSRPALTFKDNLATGDGFPGIQYRFFAMHQHDSKVCGKCWHAEDRFDPGDESKCYVRLSLVEGDLLFELNMLEDPPDPNDPELVSPAFEGDASKCDVDKQDPKNWDILVFSRRI